MVYLPNSSQVPKDQKRLPTHMMDVEESLQDPYVLKEIGGLLRPISDFEIAGGVAVVCAYPLKHSWGKPSKSFACGHLECPESLRGLRIASPFG